MPSPIAHAAAGYAIYYLSRSRAPQPEIKRIGPLPVLLLNTVGFSFLPDIDSIAGFMAGNFGRFHNNITHSLVVGLILSLVFGLLMQRINRAGFRFWFLILLLSYELHVIMDAVTVGRGVMALWPFSNDRYVSQVPLFYGLHWSDGWFSSRHLWTLATELVFATVVIAMVNGVAGKLFQPRSFRYADRRDAADPG